MPFKPGSSNLCVDQDHHLDKGGGIDVNGFMSRTGHTRPLATSRLLKSQKCLTLWPRLVPYVVFVANKFVSNWSFYLVYTFCSVSPQQKPGHAGVLCSGHFWLWWQHPGGSSSLKTRLPLPHRLPLLSDRLPILLVFLSPWGHSSLSQNLMELSVSGSKVRVFSVAKYLLNKQEIKIEQLSYISNIQIRHVNCFPGFSWGKGLFFESSLN